MTGSATAAPRIAHFPGRAPIDAYGGGGFRFAGMSHRGSILCLADGVHGWPALDDPALRAAADDATGTAQADAFVAALGAALLALLEQLSPPTFLLLGSGRRQRFPLPFVRAAYLEKRIGLDPMDTGAAARTFNVLLAERRPVAAALVAVT